MIRALAPLLFGTALILAGNGLLLTSVAVGMREGGHGLLTTAVVVTGYFVGFGLGSLRAESVVSRVGHVRAFAGFAAALAATAVAHVLVAATPFAWLLLRFVAGFSIAGLYLVIESWMNTAGEGGKRGQQLSVYMVVVHLAMASGQLLYALPDSATAEVQRYAGATFLVCLGALPVSLYTLRAPPLEPAGALSVRTLARRAPLGLATTLGAGAVAGALFGMGPVFASQTSIPVGGVATFMTAFVLGGLGFQLPMGRLSDRVDRRRVLMGAAVGTALAALLLIPAARGGPALAIGLSFAMGGFALTLYPLGLAHVFDCIEGKDALAAAGAVLAGYALGSSLGPLAAAALMQGLGSDGLLVFVASVATAVAAHAALRIHRVGPLPVAEQEPFVAMTRTTLAAAEIDPRTTHADMPEAEETHGAS